MIFVPGWRVRSAPSLSSKARHPESLCRPSTAELALTSQVIGTIAHGTVVLGEDCGWFPLQFWSHAQSACSMWHESRH